MSNMKKMLVGVIAAAIAATCAVSASAAWKKVAYDTTAIINENGSYKAAVEYELYDDNGLTTGLKVKGAAAVAYGLEPYAPVTFSAPSFERDFPNNQYVSIFVDGVDTRKVMYNGLRQNLEYRWANYAWDLASPHKVYQAKQAFINGAWFTNHTYPQQFLGDVATVKSEFNNYYGFGFFRVVGGKVVEVMPKALRDRAAELNGNLYTYLVDVEGNKYAEEAKVGALLPGAITDLTAYKDGKVDVTAQRVIDVRKAFNLVVAGPKYEMDGTVLAGNEFAKVCNSAEYRTEDQAKLFGTNELVRYMVGWNSNEDDIINLGAVALHGTLPVYATTTVEWVDAGFECAAPYNCYQILKVDGVLLDGSWVKVNGNIDDVIGGVNDALLSEVDANFKYVTLDDGSYMVKLPYVYRYTGAKANPVELVEYDNPLVATTTLKFVNAEHFHVK